MAASLLAANGIAGMSSDAQADLYQVYAKPNVDVVAAGFYCVDPTTCTSTTITYSVVTPPQYGTWRQTVENDRIFSGPCTGYSAPTSYIHYTWTAGDPTLSQDSFTVRGTSSFCTTFNVDTLAVVSTGQAEKGLGDPGCTPGGCGTGDPINIGGGNVFEQVVDFQTEGINPLAFIRYYNSRPSPSTSAASLGTDWRNNYDRYLHLTDSTHTAAERGDGQVILFTYNGTSWLTDTDVTLKLARSGSNWLLTDIHGTVETYNSSGILTSIALRDTYTQTLSYTSGKLTSVTDSQSRTLTMTYTGSLLQTVTPPGGLVLTYGYDSSGIHPGVNDRLHTVSYNTSPTTTTITYAHVNTTYPFAVTGLTDELGKAYASWTYDAYGRGLTSQHNGGADYAAVSYNDTSGDRTDVNSLGQSTLHLMLFDNGVQKWTQLSRFTTFTANAFSGYDSNGFVASLTDWNANQTTFVNNSRGLPTTRVDASGTAQQRTTTITWSSSYDVPTEIDTARNTTTFTYDSHGNMTGRTVKDITSQSVPYSTNGQTHVSTYTYDSLGHMLTATDPLSHTTTYTYDNGNLSTVKDALGHVTTYSNYTGRGQPQAMTDPNGTVTSFSYDVRGRLLTRTVSPSGGDAITTYTYNAASLLYDVNYPDGTGTSFNYDDAHRVIQVFNNFGESLDYYLDNNGDVTAQDWTDYPGTVFKVHYSNYDTLGRKTQDYGSFGQTTTYSYDSNGNRTGIVDALSKRTTQVYDALNRLTGVTDPLSHTTTYAYDSQDNRVSVKDPRSLTTSYVYDGFGQVIQEVSPDRGTIVYVRDAAGNVTSETDARGVVTSYSYDALNRVTTQTYPADSSNNITYTYDATGGGNKGIGHLTGYSDESGSTALTYDERGNVTVKARTIGSQTYTTTYSYDLADKLTQAVYPSGRIVTYTYDAVGQMSAVGTTSGGTATPLASSVTYYPFGPLKHIAYGNGLTGTFTYDTDYRAFYISIAKTGFNAELMTGALNDVDNITSITDSLDSTRTQTFTYDADYRLTSAIGKYGTVTYTYDANGNRLTRILAGTTTTYTYPGTSNLLSSTSGGAAATYTYDAAGNITNDTSGSGNTYTYESRARYHALNVGGTPTGTYLYDAVGERVSKQSGGTTTHYQYDESGHLIGENDGSTGADIREYVWLNGKPLAQIESNGTVYYIHSDLQNTVQKMTDATPTIVWDRIQQPFGEDYSITGAATGNLRFPGQYADSESGLNYNMRRDYNSGIGRYIESDPIGLHGTSIANMNIHGYARQNPVRFIDPTGDILDQYQCMIDTFLNKVLSPDDGNILNKDTQNPGDVKNSSDAQTAAPNPDDDNDPQKKGRPGDNRRQNQQVDDASRQAGLDADQRRTLGRAVENESRQGGRNLGYQDIVDIARDIKNGNY
jgi:RHS repeat-associated protein